MEKLSRLRNWLEKNDRLIALSADTVKRMKKDNFPEFYIDLLNFCDFLGFEETLPLYSKRVQGLVKMMKVFKKTGKYPSHNGVSEVSRESYNYALLYSFLCTINRYEILEYLNEFFLYIKTKKKGQLAAIGMGTGYELKMAQGYLPDWDLLGFEKDEETVAFSEQLFHYFNINNVKTIIDNFPMDIDSKVEVHYDAILLVELLEHLKNPAHALQKIVESLKGNGVIFVTMAVNIPQEDHVYHYKSINQCRQQIIESKLRLVKEFYSPSVITEFKEEKRWGFESGNYVCIAQKSSNI